ncbi:hypothetical protein ARMGADRAFT_1034303 [Armillaria gallica]|uniref:Uncharacterized protein n=1 Tax=Armillaria gallica TaxID=47427 RepID=A0A2H3DKP5_ARMGA|nr:hypothetical protein ARMGADRAFT_1034303 [Armillaria gallica]
MEDGILAPSIYLKFRNFDSTTRDLVDFSWLSMQHEAMGVDAYIGINDFDQTAWDALLTFLPPSLFLSAYEDYVHRTSPQIIATSGHCQVKTHAPLMHAPSPQCHQVEFKDKRSSKTCILSRQWDISSSTRDVPRCCITVRRASTYGGITLRQQISFRKTKVLSMEIAVWRYLNSSTELLQNDVLPSGEQPQTKPHKTLPVCIAVRFGYMYRRPATKDSEIKITRDNRSPSDEQYQAMGGLALTICIAVWRARLMFPAGLLGFEYMDRRPASKLNFGDRCLAKRVSRSLWYLEDLNKYCGGSIMHPNRENFETATPRNKLHAELEIISEKVKTLGG